MHSWGGDKPFGQVSAAGFGSASILPISYAYIEMMNGDGLKRSSEVAMLAANYLAKRLSGVYSILFRGTKGLNAHEFILDVRDFKKTAGVEAEDIAKRLMDYGLHAPTLSFPVANTLMIEPSESESLFELDRLADALLHIREEIREIETGKADKNNNVLKNAPHTADVVTEQPWNRPYSIKKAVFPVAWVKDNKFWPFVSRIDSAFGDRNFFCTCPPMEEYERKD
jgi:glycine dehydrogenase